MEGVDRIKIVKDIRKGKKIRTYTEPHSLNSSNNNSLSFIQNGDGTIKRIRNKTSYKEIYLERLNYGTTDIPFSKGRNLSYSNVYNNKINTSGNSYYSNPSKKNLKSQSFIDNIRPLNMIGKIKAKQKKREIEKLVLNFEDDEDNNDYQKNEDTYENKIKKFYEKEMKYNKISNIKKHDKENKKINNKNKENNVKKYKIENEKNFMNIYNNNMSSINVDDNENINSKIIEKLDQLSIEISGNLDRSQEIEIKNNNKINENKKYKFEPKKNKKKQNNKYDDQGKNIDFNFELSNKKNNESRNQDGSLNLQNSKIVVYSISSEKKIDQDDNKNSGNKIPNMRYNNNNEEDEKNLFSLSGSDNFTKKINNSNKEISPNKDKQYNKLIIVSNDSIFNSKNEEVSDSNKRFNKNITEELKENNEDDKNNVNNKESINIENFESNNAES